MTSSRKESSRDGQRELHYSDIWLTKSIRYQTTKEIQDHSENGAFFLYRKTKRTMIQYHELFSPANSSHSTHILYQFYLLLFTLSIR